MDHGWLLERAPLSRTSGAAIPAATSTAASAAANTTPAGHADAAATSSGVTAMPSGAASMSSASSSGTGLAEAPTAIQRHIRWRLAVLEDTLRPKKQALLELQERRKSRKNKEHDPRVSLLQTELKRSEQQRCHDMTQQKVEMRKLLENKIIKFLELTRLKKEPVSNV